MKKKYVLPILLLIGMVLFCLSVILAVIATAGKEIIGGADLSTFFFVFFSENRGMYSILAFSGLIIMIASAILLKIKRK
jgi:hypothetical protein